jgi:hypothetical protein
MDIETHSDVSLLDEYKCQAAVLLPVLEALRAELGEERANGLVLGALRDWSRRRWHRMGAAFPGGPREKWAALMEQTTRRVGNEAEIRVLRDDGEAFEADVTRCAYAEFFRQLGEVPLGLALCCDDDFYITEVGHPEVEMTRTTTLMEGASRCDFRWRFRSAR